LNVSALDDEALSGFSGSVSVDVPRGLSDFDRLPDPGKRGQSS